MFFWFFKQFYYILRKIFHGGLILLFLFFIFFIALIACKGTYAFTFEENGETITIVDPPFTITDTTPFMFGHYNGQTQYIIGTPVNTVYQDKFLVSYNEGGAAQNTFRYRYDSSHFGEWYWYTLPNKDATSWGSRNTTSHQFLKFYSGGSLLVSSLDVYSSDGNTLYFEKNYSTSVAPYISTTSTTVENWSFDYLTIYGGTYLGNTTNQCYLDFYYGSGTSNYTTVNCMTYYDLSSNTISIPRSILEQSYVIRTGTLIGFNLTVVNTTEGGSQTFYFNLGNYTLDLTSQEQQEINEDSNKQIISEINQSQQEIANELNNLNDSQQETTNSINDLHDDLMDDTVPNNTEFDLPTVEINDITASFFDALFLNLYNAITSNNDASITFTLFSRTYTVNSSQFNFLTDERFQPLNTFFALSWYGSIGYFIIKDIRKMIKKIKEGNIENVTTTDIKADIV